jgi:hypothetical protein
LHVRIRTLREHKGREREKRERECVREREREEGRERREKESLRKRLGVIQTITFLQRDLGLGIDHQ